VERPRVPPLRERELVLRLVVERLAALRVAAVPEDFAAPPLLALDARLDPELEDFAREGALRVVVLFRAVDPRELVLRPLLRAPPDDELVEDPELALASPSTDHLPDITRCAASATASAMIEPSLVALDMTLLAAAVAVSAASRPASRILRRAAGLALIAAAAAASPAASISLLIAALASLSTVSLPEDLEEPEALFFEDLAIALSPSRCGNIALAL
jgi:hypothetical protein